jgi:hypothetical protein
MTWNNHKRIENFARTLREIAMNNPVKRPAPAEDEIRDACNKLADILCEKNRKYGNAALEPIRIFSKASAIDQILTRLDDKITRMRNQQSDDTEDTELDIAGYLILLRIARNRDLSTTRNVAAYPLPLASADL